MSKSPEHKSELKREGSASSLFMLKRSSQPGGIVQKTAKVQDKYYLKALHGEIDLYDRKLAHMEKYVHFGSDRERTIAIGKMATRRANLARTAQKLMKDEIEFHSSGLPRSFRAQPEAPEHT
jgi:hypothetical protein